MIVRFAGRFPKSDSSAPQTSSVRDQVVQAIVSKLVAVGPR